MIFADPPYFLSKGKTIRINGQYKKFDKVANDIKISVCVDGGFDTS